MIGVPTTVGEMMTGALTTIGVAMTTGEMMIGALMTAGVPTIHGVMIPGPIHLRRLFQNLPLHKGKQ